MLEYRSILEHAPTRDVDPFRSLSDMVLVYFFFIGVSSPFDDTVPHPLMPKTNVRTCKPTSRPQSKMLIIIKLFEIIYDVFQLTSLYIIQQSSGTEYPVCCLLSKTFAGIFWYYVS